MDEYEEDFEIGGEESGGSKEANGNKGSKPAPTNALSGLTGFGGRNIV